MSIAYALQSIVSLSTYIDKLSSLFMDVGRSAPRYQEMVLLYPRSTKLQSHLNEYFIVVIGLCHYLFKFGQKSTVQQFTSSLSDSHLKAFQTDLEKWANSIKEQMHLNEAQESSGIRALTRRIFKSASNQQRCAINMRVLDFCSTYDHESTWKQIRKAGNTSFHTKRVEYQEWRDCSDPCTLMYTGRLGSGKSVLLANIVDDLSLYTGKEQSLVAYFFCKHDIPESLQARTIIGSLVRQLLCTIPDLSVPARSCENTLATGDTDKVLELLFQSFSPDPKVYFVLDGLDECDHQEKETLVQAVRKIQDKLKVLVCSSFREEPNNGLQSVTSQLLATRVVPLPHDNPDIEAFIAADLDRCVDQEQLKMGDPALILEIQEALLKGAQGMFLWAALQIKSLCSMKTDRAIREALADLPKDLSETFARILLKSGSSDPLLQAKTLQLVLAAYRPLTTDELREALSVTPGDANWDPSQMLNDVYSALACCGCLLTVDEEELTVRVIHHSFKQYTFNGLDGVKHMRFSPEEAQMMLADTVVTYLSYGVFETELSRVVVHPVMAQSAPSQIVQATMGFSGTSRQIAMKFLRSRRQAAFDMSKSLAEARSSFKPKLENAFRFQTYAVRYWRDHILSVSGHNDAIFRLCSKLIQRRASSLEKLDKINMTRFQWAIENGNANVLALLLQAGIFDTTSGDNNGSTPLMLAASHGYRKIVELLLSVGETDVNAKNNNGQALLAQLTEVGDIDMVELLLNSSKPDVDTRDMYGLTPLMRAVSNRHKDIVKLLLIVGKADVDARDRTGLTPLMKAVLRGYKDVAEVLLSVGKVDANAMHGGESMLMRAASRAGYKDTVEVLLSVGKADIDEKGLNGQTPLMRAARMGYKDTVRVLLNVGKADVEAKDLTGQTALMQAASLGHNDTVTLLLGVGKADIDAKDNNGYTPLMQAVRSGHRDTISLLLRAGACVDAKDNNGWTAVMLATEHGYKDVAEVLRIRDTGIAERARAT
jgi:ankyrin repeat protein